MPGDQNFTLGETGNVRQVQFAGRSDARGYMLTDDALIATIEAVGKIREIIQTIATRLDQIETRLSALETRANQQTVGRGKGCGVSDGF